MLEPSFTCVNTIAGLMLSSYSTDTLNLQLVATRSSTEIFSTGEITCLVSSSQIGSVNVVSIEPSTSSSMFSADVVVSRTTILPSSSFNLLIMYVYRESNVSIISWSLSYCFTSSKPSVVTPNETPSGLTTPYWVSLAWSSPCVITCILPISYVPNVTRSGITIPCSAHVYVSVVETVSLFSSTYSTSRVPK